MHQVRHLVEDNEEKSAFYSDNISSPYEHLHLLADAQTTQDRVKAIKKLERGGLTGSLLAGSACLEVAYSPDQPDDEKLKWLQRAEQNWLKTVNLSERRSDYVTSKSGEALTMLANLPLHQWYILMGSLPGQELTKKTYHQLAELGRAYADAYQIGLTSKVKEEVRDLDKLSGNIAELSTLLLLQRFGIREIGDQSWMAIPSLQSQNCFASPRGSNSNNCWDISVFTDYDKPSLTYKVQVKAGVYSGVPYADDVQVVSHFSDLGDKSYDLLITTVLSECWGEVFLTGNNERITSRLDARTDTLLDSLG